MIYELNKNEFYRCKDLFGNGRNMEAQAVIEGNNPGRIFVDNMEAPKTGFIWHQSNDLGFDFFGDPDNECFNKSVASFIDNVIVPDAKNRGLEWFEGALKNTIWIETYKKIFGDRNLEITNQNVYTLSSKQYKTENEPGIPKEYKAIKLTREFYESGKLINQKFVRSIILEFWGSTNNFWNKGIGYCIMYGNEVVSFCYTSFLAGETYVVGIETLKAHQGKKLAQKAAHKLVRDIIERGYNLYWDCMEVNFPSNAVAVNLGFEYAYDYKVIEFPFK
jgi:ribosomal protein S18 acetylase RimI-like enzyme